MRKKIQYKRNVIRFTPLHKYRKIYLTFIDTYNFEWFLKENKNDAYSSWIELNTYSTFIVIYSND